MKSITTLSTEKNVNVNYASSITAGYGHKKITVEIECDGEYKYFIATTNNMPAFDEAQDLEGDEKYFALFEIIESQIEDEILDWLGELN